LQKGPAEIEFITGTGFTVIVAEPERSAGIDAHVPLVRVAIVIVTLATGFTTTVVEVVLLLKAVPLLNVPLNGPVPVKNKEMVDDDPAHSVVGTADTIVPVGRCPTVTVAVPVIPPGLAGHPPAVSAVTVNGVVEEGDTGVTKGVVLMLAKFCPPNVNDHGPAPTGPRLTVRFVDPPLQIVAVPVRLEVGRGFTVTLAVPVTPPGPGEHPLDKLVTVKAVVELGLTVT